MTRAISDNDYRSQKAVLYSLMGEFAVEFEIICLNMRMGITMLATQSGLQDQNIMQAAMAEYSAAPLLKVFRSMFMDSKWITTEVEQFLKDINRRMIKLTETRNQYIHGTIFVGWGNGDETEFTHANGHKIVNTSTGTEIKNFTVDEETFRPILKECRELAALVQETWTVALYGHLSAPDADAGTSTGSQANQKEESK